MVKTGGEGGKGQTVRSGGGKGPAFEGGQTPWARRFRIARLFAEGARHRPLPHAFAVVNLHDLADWDTVGRSHARSRSKSAACSKRSGRREDSGRQRRPARSLPQRPAVPRHAVLGSAREALAAAGAHVPTKPAVSRR